jgi:hypothetical protein
VHRRRGGYWKVYHLTHTLELDSLVRDIVVLVKECCPPVRVKLSRRGRRPVHSWEKMVCLLMVILGLSFRDIWSLDSDSHGMNHTQTTQPYIGLIIRSP